MKFKYLAALAVVLMQFSSAVVAQVYRCEVDGKVRYSDEPCLGAKRVDVRPTRGLDKMSGKSLKGADVRTEESNRYVAEALRPIYRETPDQRATRHRRARNHLTPEETAECYLTDSRLGRLEAEEKTAMGRELQQVQQNLLKARQRHRKLRC